MERRRRQADLRRLEHKIEVVKQQEDWEFHHRQLMQFSQTKATPGVFWKPAKHCAETLEKLEESRKRLDEAMALRRNEMEDELQTMNHARILVEEPTEVAEMEPEEEPALLAEENLESLEMIAVDETPTTEFPQQLEEEAAADEGKENQPEMSNGQPPTLSGAEHVASEPLPNNGEEEEVLPGDSGAEPVPEVAKDEVWNEGEIAALVPEGNEAERIYETEQNLTEKEFEPIYD